MAATEIHGRCAPKFEAAKAAFASNFESGADIGASFAATVDGELVVDLWAGWADEAKTKPWKEDTIVNVYSTTKTMAAITALYLADKAVLDLHAPVVKYWPEFAANGKANIKVSHILSHSAGLSGWQEKVTAKDCADWEKMTSLLAAQAPWWEPGTASGYHALTQGYLIGEVVRRASGRTIGTVFREDIAGPLGADFHIGLDAKHDARVGDLIPSTGSAAIGGDDPNSLSARTFGNPPMTALEPRERWWRGAEIPAAGGIGNARSVAQVQTLIANGGVSGGKRIMSEAGARRAFEKQITSTDLIFGTQTTFGMGYGLPGGMLPLPHENSCFWGGWGGSLVIADADARACIAYVPNRMVGTTTGDARGFAVLMAMFGALG